MLKYVKCYLKTENSCLKKKPNTPLVVDTMTCIHF